MPGVSLSIGGLDKLEAKLRAAVPVARQNVKRELYQFAEEVMSDSKELVPVKFGELMSSGHVDLPVETGSVISVQMGYGNESVGYALYVHEALEGAQPPSPDWSWTKKVEAGGEIAWTRPGSGPKYLERPLRAKQDQLPPRILQAVKDGLLGT